MGAADGAQFRRPTKTGKGQKLVNVNFVSTSGFGIGDVGEPFESEHSTLITPIITLTADGFFFTGFFIPQMGQT
jgi:hypothetical protein